MRPVRVTTRSGVGSFSISARPKAVGIAPARPVVAGGGAGTADTAVGSGATAASGRARSAIAATSARIAPPAKAASGGTGSAATAAASAPAARAMNQVAGFRSIAPVSSRTPPGTEGSFVFTLPHYI